MVCSNAKGESMKEARALARLKHPHIVTMIAAHNTAEGAGYIIQELSTKGSLGTHLHNESLVEHPFTYGEILVMCIQVAGAIAHIHSIKFVHRGGRPQ
eukprot:8279687-Pyramimonas_sp.AAC.2